MAGQTFPKNIRPKEAAAAIGVSVSTLAKWRMRKEGPAFKKIGRRIVIYRPDELARWIDAQSSQPGRAE